MEFGSCGIRTTWRAFWWELLTDREAAKAMGERGRQVFGGAEWRDRAGRCIVGRAGEAMRARRPWAWPLVPLYAAALAMKGGLRTTGMVQARKLQWPVGSGCLWRVG